MSDDITSNACIPPLAPVSTGFPNEDQRPTTYDPVTPYGPSVVPNRWVYDFILVIRPYNGLTFTKDALLSLLQTIMTNSPQSFPPTWQVRDLFQEMQKRGWLIPNSAPPGPVTGPCGSTFTGIPLRFAILLSNLPVVDPSVEGYVLRTNTRGMY